MTRNRYATSMAGFFLLFGAGILKGEVVCGKAPRLKPVRCLCGKFIDLSGGPVSGVTVRVLRDGAEVAMMETGVDGRFIFHELRPGNYELDAQADSFMPFRSSIVVAKPAKRCKCRLVVFLDIGGLERCGSWVMKQ